MTPFGAVRNQRVTSHSMDELEAPLRAEMAKAAVADRFDQIAGKLPELIKSISGAALPPSAIRIEPLMVTNTIVPMQFAYGLPIAVENIVLVAAISARLR